MNLQRLQRDPAEFRRALLIDCDGTPRPLAEVMEPWQAADFAALDPAWRLVAGQPAEPTCQRAWMERPRGHSKTTDVAVMVSWSLFAARRKLSGIVAAGDSEQARLIRDAIDGLCRLNPWLARILDVQALAVVNRHTGSRLEIISSDAPSSYGLTPDFIVCDEVVHWRGRDLFDSLLSAAAKRGRCLLLCITNAGFQPSWQWDIREAARCREGWHFSRLEGPQASWITADVLEEQRALLPSIAFERLWLNRWSSGSGDAFDPSDIAAAMTLPSPLTGPEPGWQYVAGLDVGLRHDSTAFCIIGKHVGRVERRPSDRQELGSPTLRALVDVGAIECDPVPADDVIVHNGSGRLRLAQLRIWTPSAGKTIDLSQVERTVLELSKRFRARVGFDPWQAIQLSQNLRRQGVPMQEIAFNASTLQSMARATLNAFQDRQVELFPNETLEADLRCVRVVERGHGGFRLDAPRSASGAGTRHADTVTALSIALQLAQSSRIVGKSLDPKRKLVLHD